MLEDAKMVDQRLFERSLSINARMVSEYSQSMQAAIDACEELALLHPEISVEILACAEALRVSHMKDLGKNSLTAEAVKKLMAARFKKLLGGESNA